MFKRIRDWWRAKQRSHDLRILWPICKKEAGGDVEKARNMFHLHMLIDPAWSDIPSNQRFQTVRNLV